MWRPYGETRRVAAWALLILPGIVALGCSGPPPMNPDVPVENRILMLVEDVDDYSQNKNELERIRPLFAPGSGPSKEGLSRYTAYRYEGKTPVRSGDSATIAVAIKDAKTGNPAGEMQWSAIKVNNIWRLKDAPLPDARK